MTYGRPLNNIWKIIVNDSKEVTTTSTSSTDLKTYTGIKFTAGKLFRFFVYASQDSDATSTTAQWQIKVGDGTNTTIMTGSTSSSNGNKKNCHAICYVGQDEDGTSTQAFGGHADATDGNWRSTSNSRMLSFADADIVLNGSANWIDQDRFIIDGKIGNAAGGTLRLKRVIIEELDDSEQ